MFMTIIVQWNLVGVVICISSIDIKLQKIHHLPRSSAFPYHKQWILSPPNKVWTDWARWWGNTPDRSQRGARLASAISEERRSFCQFWSLVMRWIRKECMYHYCNCNHILYCSFIFRIITLFLTVTLNMAFLSHINYICVLITFNFIGFGQFYGAVSTEGDTREILCKGSIQFSYFYSGLKLIFCRQNIQ